MSNFISILFRIFFSFATFFLGILFFFAFFLIALIGSIAFKIDSWIHRRQFSSKDYFKSHLNKAQQQKVELNSRFNKQFNQRLKRFQREDQTIDISDGEFEQKDD